MSPSRDVTELVEILRTDFDELRVCEDCGGDICQPAPGGVEIGFLHLEDGFHHLDCLRERQHAEERWWAMQKMDEVDTLLERG